MIIKFRIILTWRINDSSSAPGCLFFFSFLFILNAFCFSDEFLALSSIGILFLRD